MNPIKITATDAKVQFGATMEKAKSGRPVIIEKNNTPQVVMISIDDYEDFLEVKNEKSQKNIEKSAKEIKTGKTGTLDNLYKIHRKTIAKEGAR